MRAVDGLRSDDVGRADVGKAVLRLQVAIEAAEEVPTPWEGRGAKEGRRTPSQGRSRAPGAGQDRARRQKARSQTRTLKEGKDVGSEGASRDRYGAVALLEANEERASILEQGDLPTPLDKDGGRGKKGRRVASVEELERLGATMSVTRHQV